MANQRGGIKLRRSSKDKNYYAAQFAKTTRNKARRMARVARRKKEMPKQESGLLIYG